jgi:hypothetical protein
LNWSPPKKDGGSPITSYKLEISEDGKTWTPLDASEAIKYVAKGLKDGQKYFFKVAAINEVGEGEYLVFFGGDQFKVTSSPKTLLNLIGPVGFAGTATTRNQHAEFDGHIFTFINLSKITYKVI